MLKFQVPGDSESEGTHFNAIRVCFAWEDEDLLEEGIERLARVIRRLRNEQKEHGHPSTQCATRESAKGFW